MWCPPDFHHIHEIEFEWERAARELVPRQQGRELLYLDENKHEFDYEKSNQFRRLVVEGKLLELFLSENLHKAFACSPSGQMMRLSWQVVRPVIYNHWMEYNRRFSSGPSLLYVDLRTGKIKPDKTAEKIRSWTDEEDADHAETWQEDAIQDFGDITGWIVCYARSEVVVTKDHFIELWKRFMGDDAKTKGRPREREAVKEAYRQIFPNGHGALTQKEVIRKLAEHGQDTSVDTLRRALGKRE